MTNSDGYNINTFLIIVNIVNQVTTISDMLQRESGNQVVTQIWECVSTMVRIGYSDSLLEIWVSKEAQWVVSFEFCQKALLNHSFVVTSSMIS